MLEGLEISIIEHSKLENFSDFSPEYYQKSHILDSNNLRKKPFNSIAKIAYVTDGEHGSPDWDELSKIKYVTAESIRPNYILDIDFDTISEAQFSRNARAALRENDVLIYSVGAYAGYAAKAEKHLFPASIPRSVAIVRLQDKAYKPEYLSVFLNSRFGAFQTKRFRAGNAQPMLALEKINQFEIPVLNITFQNEIALLYNNAYMARLNSKDHYLKAERALLELVGLADFKHTIQNINIKSVVQSFGKSGRLDAEYYQLKYEAFENAIKSNINGYTVIKNEYDHLNTVSRKPKATYHYIEISDVNVGDGTNSPNIIETNELPANAKFEVMKGDLIISKVRPNRGAISVIESDFDNLIVSGAFTVLREKPSSVFTKEVLKVLLRTPIYREWMLQFNVGTQYPVIRDEDILNLPIPIIDLPTQTQISQLVQESFVLKAESERLLNVAKRAVDIAIEQDEAAGLAYIKQEAEVTNAA